MFLTSTTFSIEGRILPLCGAGIKCLLESNEHTHAKSVILDQPDSVISFRRNEAIAHMDLSRAQIIASILGLQHIWLSSAIQRLEWRCFGRIIGHRRNYSGILLF